MAARINRAKHQNVVLGSRKRQQHAIIPLSGRKDRCEVADAVGIGAPGRHAGYLPD